VKFPKAPASPACGARTAAASVFTLHQDGAVLTGTVEGGGGRGGGGDTPTAIEDGKVDGDNVSFRAGTVTYTGAMKPASSNYSAPAPPTADVEAAAPPPLPAHAPPSARRPTVPTLPTERPSRP